MKRSLEEAGLNPLEYTLKKSNGSKKPQCLESVPVSEEIQSSSSESSEEKFGDLDCKSWEVVEDKGDHYDKYLKSFEKFMEDCAVEMESGKRKVVCRRKARDETGLWNHCSASECGCAG